MSTSKHILSITTLIVLFLALSPLTSCKKNTVDDKSITEAQVVFNIDWSKISSASAVPDHGKLWLYPADGTTPIVSDIVADNSITMKLKAGTYNMIVYNDNLDVIKLRGIDQFATHEGYLELSPVKTKASWAVSKVEAQVESADFLHILSGATPRVIEVTAGKDNKVTLVPRTITNVYSFNVKVTAPSPIESGHAMLTGVATSVNLATAQLHADVAAVAHCDLSVSPSDNSTLVGAMYALGADPKVIGIESGGNIADIVIKYKDPERAPIEVSVDLSNEFTDPNINLDVQVDLDIEKDIPTLSITVEAWQTYPGENITPEFVMRKPLKINANKVKSNIPNLQILVN